MRGRSTPHSEEEIHGGGQLKTGSCCEKKKTLKIFSRILKKIPRSLEAGYSSGCCRRGDWAAIFSIGCSTCSLVDFFAFL